MLTLVVSPSHVRPFSLDDADGRMNSTSMAY